MAFATANKLYMIDRNGKNVSPFPIKFKDLITQPLSVFDYDNNRKYRFVITQGREIYIYDSRGKIVKGFTFKKAASNIVLSPQHGQVDNKGYIAIAEENGKLNLLSRFAVKGNNKVTLDDNLLRINGKLVTLPFGIYTKPQLFFANKTTYISITETQENKVYVYDTSGSLLKGFPVFGTSIASIAEASKKGGIRIVVKGEKNELVGYSFH
jgi:hypothetical protein